MLQRRVLVAAEVRGGFVQYRHRPAVPLGIADVHPGQIRGEQCRFFAALTGFDFEHDVVGVMRVARRQHVGELGVQFGDP